MSRKPSNLIHDIFDYALARAAGDAAIKQAGDAAPPEWIEDVKRIIAGTPLGAEFTADDVWAGIPEDKRPPEPRALGSVFRSLRAAGKIAPTPTYRPSARVACHARPIRVWRRL